MKTKFWQRKPILSNDNQNNFLEANDKNDSAKCQLYSPL